MKRNTRLRNAALAGLLAIGLALVTAAAVTPPGPQMPLRASVSPLASWIAERIIKDSG